LGSVYWYSFLVPHPLSCSYCFASFFVSILLLLIQVIGLDINPRAIKCAQINLFLNALNPDGSPCLDSEGKSLLDRVEFHESDLLAHCTQNKIVLDRIVGCIPQVWFRAGCKGTVSFSLPFNPGIGAPNLRCEQHLDFE
jgi:hypothetical protein